MQEEKQEQAAALMQAAALEQALGRTRWSVIGLLVACGVVIVLRGFEGEEPPPDRLIATTGIALALATIVLRGLGSSPRVAPRLAVFFRLGGMLLCAALGLLGVYLAFSLASPETGILFTAAGLIFALRPTPPVARR